MARRPLPSVETRLRRAAARLRRGEPVQVTVLLAVRSLPSELRRCLGLWALEEATRLPASSMRLSERNERLGTARAALHAFWRAYDALPVDPDSPAPVHRQEYERQHHRVVALRRHVQALQPGFKRVGIHAMRRTGTDRGLLVAGTLLTGGLAPPPALLHRALGYLVCRYDDLRFRLGPHEADRLEAVAAAVGRCRTGP